MNDCILCDLRIHVNILSYRHLSTSIKTYNTIRLRISFNHLEFNSSHTATNKESIALADGSIGFQEVGLEESFKEVTSQTFNSVINRQDMDTFTVFDIRTRMKSKHITKTNTQVVTDNFYDGWISNCNAWNRMTKQNLPLLILALLSSISSSANTIRTVSLLFFPLTMTVSPLKSWSLSIVAVERVMTELSSFVASSTINLLGAALRRKMAVAGSWLGSSSGSSIPELGLQAC